MIVAIDGPAASGKGTLGKRLASHLRLAHLDTGLLYRAVAQSLLATGGTLDDEALAAEAARNLDIRLLDPETLRGPGMGEGASVIAALPAVRAALIALQRDFANQPGGAVLDGRDIGTVICPEADVKVFVTASAEERARRRHGEFAGRGENVSFDEVLADIRARDARDTARATAPLRPAEDACLLDTTELDIEAAFRAALAIVEAAAQRPSSRG